jgi:MYXO-CTERM domain-containing protein
LGNVPFGVSQNYTWTIANSGNAPLTLTGSPDLVVLTAGANISALNVTAMPATPVAAAGTATLTISFTITAPGAFDFDVSIENDDADENPYTWTVAGTGAGNVPEIDVSRGPLGVPHGGVDSVGNTGISAPLVLTYSLSNTGGATLNLTGAPLVNVANATNCTVQVTAPPAASLIPPAGSEAFTVEVTPSGGGAFAFSVSISNDDADENPYGWVVVGTAGSTGGGNGGSGGGGDGGDEESCSTASAPGSTHLLLALAAAAAVLSRSRRREA